MALSILDGNQSATTLSTIVSSGQHIPSHTVVSLGSQAISNITSAISGTSVCVGNLGLLQSTVGTEGITANTNFIKIGGHTGTSTTGNIAHVSAVGAIRVDGSNYTQPVSLASVPTHGVTLASTTVTIGAGTAQIGSVTASLQASSVTGSLKSLTYQDISTVAFLNVAVGSLPALTSGTNQIGSVTASISGTVPISISSVTVGNSVTIGSLPAISGTVTANLSISSTAITSGSFTSLTSATLVPANTARKMATVYNLGAGQLFINAGASATTLGGGFMVALSSGDFYECDYTTTTLSAIFATAGTASWMSH